MGARCIVTALASAGIYWGWRQSREQTAKPGDMTPERLEMEELSVSDLGILMLEFKGADGKWHKLGVHEISSPTIRYENLRKLSKQMRCRLRLTDVDGDEIEAFSYSDRIGSDPNARRRFCTSP